MLVVERLLELRAAGGVYVALGGDDPRPRGMVAAEVEELGSGWFAGDRLEPDDFREKLGLGAGAHPRRPTPRCARGSSAPRPSAATGTAAASTRRSAGARDDRADARAGARGRAPRRLAARARRRRARARRRCSSSASCARCVDDGAAVESMLAITFTEKAAAEMKTRVRRRFLELGRREDARAAEGAWISTIHGLLRAHAARARAQRRHRPGLPRARPGRGRPARARGLRRRARGVHGGRRGPRAHRDGGRVHARTGCATWCAPPTRTCAAAGSGGRRSSRPSHRSRRASASGSRPPPARRSPSSGPAPASAAVATRDRACSRPALDLLGARATGELARRRPELKGIELKGAREGALDRRHARTTATRLRRVPLVRARAPRAARPHDAARRCSSSTASATSAPSGSAPGSTSRTSSWSPATCSPGDAGLREAYAGRFAHVLVDEFQDTNPLQNELLELLARDNLFRVGDENQSIYRFRNADVGVFREPLGRRGRGGPRREHHRQLPRARRDPRRGRPRLRAHLGRAFRAAARGARRARAGAARRPLRGAARGREAEASAGTRRRASATTRSAPALAQRAALAGGGGAPAREADRRAHPRRALRVRRRRDAVPGDHRDGLLRARARGARHPRARGRRPRLLRASSRCPTCVTGSSALANPLDGLAVYSVLASPLAGPLARRGRADRPARPPLRAATRGGPCSEPADELLARAARRGPAPARRRSSSASRRSGAWPARWRSRR